jgi:hypothetical protein
MMTLMGYMDGMENLYRPEGQHILREEECYALEKAHGTSVHVRKGAGQIHYSPGGVSLASFLAAIEDRPRLEAGMLALPAERIKIHGEAYGGKCQGMAHVYGPKLRFVVFDILVGEEWLDVPEAEALALSLGLEFVPYARVPTTLEALDAERDRPSELARRRGMGDHQGEGSVLRPLKEKKTPDGKRMIAKHKHAKYGERAHVPAVAVDPGKLAVLEGAQEIAEEFVTDMRLDHVLDALATVHGRPMELQDMALVLPAMTADIYKEAREEVVQTKETTRAISKRTAALFVARITRIPGGGR